MGKRKTALRIKLNGEQNWENGAHNLSLGREPKWVVNNYSLMSITNERLGQCASLEAWTQWRIEDFGSIGVPSILFPSFPSLSFLFPSHSPALLLFCLRSRPFNSARGLGECCKLPQRVWDRGPAEVEFGAFLPQNMTAGGNKFSDFPDN